MKKENKQRYTDTYRQTLGSRMKMPRCVKKIDMLEKKTTEQARTIECLTLHIEELQQIIFGNGKKKQRNENEDTNSVFTKQSRKKRTAASYRRAVPKEEEVTDREYHGFGCCPHCRGSLTDSKEVERYREDVLPMEA